MNLIIVSGMFVCSSFLISVCLFIVSKALLISSATVIVRVGGAIWLNPFATVLFSVCNNNNNNCLKSNIQCIEIRVQWTVHLGSSHIHVHAVTRVHAVLYVVSEIPHSLSRGRKVASIHGVPRGVTVIV